MTPRCTYVITPRACLTKPRPCARAGVVVRDGRLYCRQHGRDITARKPWATQKAA